MKVSIEFEVDSRDRKIVHAWLDKVTKDIRVSRFIAITGSLR